MQLPHHIWLSFILLTCMFAGQNSENCAQQPATGDNKPIPDLIVAIRHGDYTQVNKLLDQGADPYVRDPHRGMPAFMWPFLINDEQGVAIFSRMQLDIDPISARGGLASAAASGDIELAKVVIDKAETARGGGLFFAAASGDLNMVRLFLKNGADPNRRDGHADTPLMAAARTGNADVVRALLAMKADAEAEDSAGRSVLHWAVRSGSKDVVNEILNSGVDTSVRDNAGATPAELAARRGNFDIVDLFANQGIRGELKREVSAPTSPESALRKSLPLLQKGADAWLERSSCISCHHQGMIVSTTALAKKQGFPVNEDSVWRQVDAIINGDHRFKSMQGARKSLEARLAADFDGGLGLRAAFFLSALADCEVGPNNYIAVVADILSDSQWMDGRWSSGMHRSPMSSSDFAATAYAVRGLALYSPEANRKKIRMQIDRAKNWMLASTPKSTDDKCFRLLGLDWVGASAKEIKKAAQPLLLDQRKDGGWSQTPTLPSDAYATGQVMVALHQAGQLQATDTAFQRGVEYLLRTQEGDGSWLVSSRSIPQNAFFESGFPHGKHQFISFAGSCWATQALLLTLSTDRSSTP